MKIVGVRCVEYLGALESDEPFWGERLRRPTDVYPFFAERGPTPLRRRDDGRLEVRQVFLHVDTDAGLVGTAAVLSREQAFVVREVLAPIVTGLDPLAGEYVWDIAYRSMIHGRAGIGMLALSALDCALWDVRGQHFGVPVHVLLGGPTRDTVPAYVSTLGDPLDIDAVQDRTGELVAAGFGAVKWFPRRGPGDGRRGVDEVVALVAAVREAGGAELEIMLDAWCSWDVEFAAAVARGCEPLGLRWIEEALLPDDTAGQVALRRAVAGRTQLAGGEHEYTRWGHARLLREDLLDVYQADPHWCGGISELLRVAALVSAAGRPLVPHGQSLQCNAALTFAASPAAIPQMEYLRRLAPLYQHFLADPIVARDGVIRAPTAPGLGMQLAPERILDSVALASPDRRRDDVTVLACLSDYDEALVRRLAGNPDGLEVRIASRTGGRDELLRVVADAEIVVADAARHHVLDAGVLAAMQRCRFVQQPAVGYDSVDVVAAARAGIAVANAPGYNAEAVADWTVMAMLIVLRDGLGADAAARSGRAQPGLGRELGALTVGLVGFGAIGSAVRRRLHGFGSRVVFAARRARAATSAEQLPLDDVFRRSDIVSLHLPLVSETRGIVDAARLRLLPDGAVLVNAARGGLVDEDALVAGLRTGRPAAAALDVFAREPLDPRSPLCSLRNVYLSPHVAAGTEQARVRVRELVGANLRRVLAGQAPRDVVNGVGNGGAPAAGGG